MTVATFSMMAEGLAWRNPAKRTSSNSSNTSKGKGTSTTFKKSTSRKRQLQLTPTVNVIQDYVERVVRESTILNGACSNSNREITSCARSALSVGRLVGEGSFSQVCAVRRRGHSNKGQVIKQLHPNLFTVSVTSTTSGTQTNDNDKLIRRAQEALDQAAADLLLEALILSSLSHPNLVTVSALSTSVQDAFVCLEHLPATIDSKMKDWRQKNAAGQLNRPAFLVKQLGFATQIASALQYLHSKRVIFRDLKPENIGIAKDGETIKLFDFGLCRELPPAAKAVVESPEEFTKPTQTHTPKRISRRNSLMDSTSTSCHSAEFLIQPASADDNSTFHMTQVGTMRYCAGEILLGQAYNAKCDIYSFAIVLYEMVTLQTAFPNIDMRSEDSQQEHLAKVCVGGKRPGLSLYQLPQGVERIIRKTWQRNHLKRWNSAQLHQAMIKEHALATAQLP